MRLRQLPILVLREFFHLAVVLAQRLQGVNRRFQILADQVALGRDNLRLRKAVTSLVPHQVVNIGAVSVLVQTAVRWLLRLRLAFALFTFVFKLSVPDLLDFADLVLTEFEPLGHVLALLGEFGLISTLVLLLV